MTPRTREEPLVIRYSFKCNRVLIAFYLDLTTDWVCLFTRPSSSSFSPRSMMRRFCATAAIVNNEVELHRMVRSSVPWWMTVVPGSITIDSGWTHNRTESLLVELSGPLSRGNGSTLSYTGRLKNERDSSGLHVWPYLIIPTFPGTTCRFWGGGGGGEVLQWRGRRWWQGNNLQGICRRLRIEFRLFGIWIDKLLRIIFVAHLNNN